MISNMSEVVTNRPFHSVKEAVAMFSERQLAGNAYSPVTASTEKLEPTPNPIYAAFSPQQSFSSSSSQFTDELRVISLLKKLEAELEKTKQELMLLKERETETEIIVASLNAELHQSIAKLSVIKEMDVEKMANGKKDTGMKEEAMDNQQREEQTMDFELSPEYLPTLAQALGLPESEYGAKRKSSRTIKKKKPIVPLIGDLFFKKKVSKETHAPHY